MMQQKINQKMQLVLPIVLLILCAYALFANTFPNGWTYDDFPVITRNSDILSLDNFMQDDRPGRPVRELTYILDYSLFGMEPAGWRIQHIFWHGLNGVLLFFLALRIRNSRLFAWLTSLTFLVHPIQVEVVANISHRKDSIALAFALAATLFYIKALENAALRRWCLLLLGVASWFVAIYAKQNVFGLPILLGAYELLFLPRDKRLIFRYRPEVLVPIACAGIVAVVAGLFLYKGGLDAMAIRIQGPLMKMQHYGDRTFAYYYILVFKSLAFMFAKFFWPFNLAVEYVYPIPDSFFSPWPLAGITGLVALPVAFVAFCKRAPIVSFGLLWMTILWLPTSNLLWPLAYFSADRYLYTASVGVFLIVALLLEKLFDRQTWLAGCVICAMIISLSVLTWQQNKVWKSDITLYTHALKVSPESTFALMGMGIGHMQVNQLQQAHDYMFKAAMNLNHPLPIYYLGLIKEKMGDIPGALRSYKRFLAMNDPRYKREVYALRKYLPMKYGIKP